jgi:hypothetical protein
MKKYSDDTIPQIVILGDGRYEFCFAQGSETTENEGREHISYFADVVTVDGVPEKDAIISALMADGKTESEANELVKNLVP